MAAWFLHIKWIHIWAVILSGGLFTLRGIMMMLHSNWTNHVSLRYLSVLIDTTLLTAAILLTLILHQYPFVQAWLTVKVVLLVVYIVLGTLALKRGRTRAVRMASYVAALAVYLFIVSVARSHNPWGALAPLLP